MEIIRAKTAGFCMGLSLALRKLDQALDTLRGRFGKEAVQRGRLFRPGEAGAEEKPGKEKKGGRTKKT